MCSSCNGDRLEIDERSYLRLQLHMRSPRFNATPNIEAQVRQEYRAAERNWTQTPAARWSVTDSRLISQDFAVMEVRANGYEPGVVRWIWASDTKGNEDWHIYTPDVDGPWPDELAELTPLSKADEREVLDQVKSAGHLARVSSVGTSPDGTLVVRMKFNNPSGNHDSGVGNEGVRVARAVLGNGGIWPKLHVDWLVPWHAADVAPVWMPLWTSEIDDTAYKQVAWQNLEPGEQIKILKWTKPPHDGWSLEPVVASLDDASNESHGELLNPDQEKAAKTLLAPLKTTFHLHEARHRGDDLLLWMRPRADLVNAADYVSRDAVALMRAIHSGQTGWKRIIICFSTQWRNSLGRIEWKPVWTCSATRKVLDAVVWKNLSPSEQKDVLTWSYAGDYEGWIAWPRE